MNAKSVFRILTVSVLSLSSFACTHQDPTFVYMPDMVYSPAFKAQKPGVMLPPVKGTIPRDFEPYPFAGVSDDKLAKPLKNPLRPTMQVLNRGQSIFNTYCIACHGPMGEGDGSVVPRFPRPPSLQSDKIRHREDGRIYHIISVGRNLMPSYASQIAPGDRWSAIFYIRALQKAKHPTPEEVKSAESH